MNRRTLLSTGLLGMASVTLAACSSTATASSSSTASAAAGGPGAGGPGGAGAGMGASAETTAAKTLAAEVAEKFTQATYTDASSGKTLPYNVFLPDGYSASKSYPLVLYIADSSLVGQAVTAPLNQYGALIWATAAEQAKRKAIVVVPEFPEIILDDHGSHTTTAYVELTGRFVTWLQTKYAVDAARVYGTGQSMGCMTVMLLAAEHPDLFTAELFVSGQWEASKLAGLTKAKFFFIAAGGDSNSTGGQTDVKKILTTGGVRYSATTLDATWSDARIEAAAKTLLAKHTRDYFVSFKTGTVLTANPTAGGMEHMASFEPAYKITAARDWLFAQSR